MVPKHSLRDVTELARQGVEYQGTNVPKLQAAFQRISSRK